MLCSAVKLSAHGFVPFEYCGPTPARGWWRKRTTAGLSLTSFCFLAGYVLGEAQEFLEWVLLPQKHFASKDYKTCG
jgi:hypothetical protein